MNPRSTMSSGAAFRRLAIVGVSGRMGTEIRALAEDFGFQVTAGVSKSMAAASDSTAAGMQVVARVEELDSSRIDIAIDFSMPEATRSVVQWCESARVPLVSGVTGLDDQQRAALRRASSVLPVLWSANMSLGIAVMARMFDELKHLDGFDFQIEELHHKRKRDKPSGTALFLRDRLHQATGENSPEPLSIRGGGIFGIHRIWAMGEDEVMTIEHTAMSRRVFARGALKAANWLMSQEPGLYRMDDVLGT